MGLDSRLRGNDGGRVILSDRFLPRLGSGFPLSREWRRVAGLAGHRFRRIGGAAGFGRIAWIGGLKPVSTARLYSLPCRPLVLRPHGEVEASVAAGVSESG
ncbi:hypothetical protein E0J81_06395 [Neisseria gonorrhoeae]